MEHLVEELVNSKSHPSPSRIEEIQKEIQRLQRQTTGWETGLSLLKKDESHLRFYGALTLIIKIRTDWNFLETQHEFRNAVLRDLIQCYVEFTNQLEQAFVLRKFPLRHVLTSLCHGYAFADEHLSDFHGVWAGLLRVNAPQLRSTLWLSSSMVEEVSKFNMNGVSSAQLAMCISKNALDVWSLIYSTLRGLHLRLGLSDLKAPLLPDYVTSIPESDLVELSKIALDTASIWINAHASWEVHDSSIEAVTDAAMALIARCFFVPQIAENTMSCLKIIIEQAPKYLTKRDDGILPTLLNSKQAELYVTTLLQGNFEPEAIHFVEFLGSLMDLHDLSTPEAIENGTTRDVIGHLRRLLYTPGIAVVVDETCQTVLDTFNQIADGWSDWVGTSSADQLLKPILHETCLQFAVKIEYPSQESDYPIDSWEADERAKFHEFRHDVQDLLLSSYACVGPDLIKHFAAPLQSSDMSPGWEDFEAQLFCLGAFSDIIASETAGLGHHVTDVLASQKWNLLTSNVQAVPERARQGAINFISRNTDLLQHSAQHLFSCLNFLFTSLQLHGSTFSASRAIFTLCQKQRSLLVDVLPQFIDSISVLTDVPCEDRHRLFAAIAAIIQAISPEASKVAPLVGLLNLVPRTCEERQVQTGDTRLASAIDVLQTLAAVGKGLRAPPETPINIDSQAAPDQPDFWIEGGGKHVQQTLQNTIDRVLTTSPIESPLIEATCEILKSGYTEAHPSPFKLAPSHNAALLVRLIRIDLPGIGLIIDTASAFLASQPPSSHSIPSEVLQIASVITHCHCTLLECFAVTKTYDDHEFTHSSIEFFTRMLPRFECYFIDKSLSQAWRILFEFALVPLQNADTLPRRSAAQFWAAIFELSASISGDAARNLHECLEYFGSRFATILLRLLGGEAARSELDVLSEPLKKFVNKQGLLASKLLREAAVGLDSGDGKVKRFVEQTIALRGAGKTREIAKDFWIGARGTAYAYAG